MLGAKYVNYIPAAIEAGLMPLLMIMLSHCTSEDSNACSALMRSLRLVTSTSRGARTVLDSEKLHQTVLNTCIHSMQGWLSRYEQLCIVLIGGASDEPCLSNNTKAALRAATDAVHTAANLWTSGMSIELSYS
jgi:hypothetical protein